METAKGAGQECVNVQIAARRQTSSWPWSLGKELNRRPPETASHRLRPGHLVSAQQDRLGDIYAQHLGGLEIDYEHKPDDNSWLHFADLILSPNA